MLDALRNGGKCALIAFCAAVAIAYFLTAQAEENAKAEVNTLRAEVASLRAEVRELHYEMSREFRALRNQLLLQRARDDE